MAFVIEFQGNDGKAPCWIAEAKETFQRPFARRFDTEAEAAAEMVRLKLSAPWAATNIGDPEAKRERKPGIHLGERKKKEKS